MHLADADIEGILAAEIAGMSRPDLTIGNIILLFPLPSDSDRKYHEKNSSPCGVRYIPSSVDRLSKPILCLMAFC